MSRLYNILDAIVKKLIIVNTTNNYIKIGKFAMCWGSETFSSINTTKNVLFPITFASPPFGYASWHGAATGNVYNMVTAYNETTTGMTLYHYKTGGSATSVNWLAVGFIS